MWKQAAAVLLGALVGLIVYSTISSNRRKKRKLQSVGCCGTDAEACCPSADGEEELDEAQLKAAVRSRYGQVAGAAREAQSQGTFESQQGAADRVAKAFGYTEEELKVLPSASNLGLSCGNPTALASLKPGEVVLDLGCGGGLDVFLAVKKVGPTGRVIGVDMTERMIALARTNALKRGLTNVEFHLAEIEDMRPVANGTIDCVISNCVINLVPNKARALQEIFRVLKPGGRVVLSDIALKRELPAAIKRDVLAYTGCISGAILIDEYQRLLRESGFRDVAVVDKHADLNAYKPQDDDENRISAWARSITPKAVQAWFTDDSAYDFNEWAASVHVYALKP